MRSLVKKAIDKARKKIETKKKVGEKDLEKVFKKSIANIFVVGCGGAGGNTISRMQEVGIKGAKLTAVNTDAQDLLESKADKKVLIGKKLLKGLGAGSNPDVGESAAKESKQDIKGALRKADLVFVTCGLGGGTGTGSAPIVSEISQNIGALTVAVVTLPFTVEGRTRVENALKGLARLKKSTDTIIIIPNDKILEVAPDLPIDEAFGVADEILTNAVKGIVELITKPGLVNLDFADLKTILKNGGAALIGLGESQTEKTIETRALEAVEDALTSPLLDVDISQAKRALINVMGGKDLTIKEAEMVVESVASRIHPESHVIWGATIDKEIKDGKVRVMVVVAGGRFPYLEGVTEEDIKIPEKALMDLDIKFVD